MLFLFFSVHGVLFVRGNVLVFMIFARTFERRQNYEIVDEKYLEE